MEAYMDDIFVKSKKIHSDMEDLIEAFKTLMRFNMCLKPIKYIFKV